VATLAEVAQTTRRSGRLLIALAALPAVAGAALLLGRALESSGSTGAPSATTPDPAPPAIYARKICSLSNDDARAALVQGADGGQSVVVDGRTWWLFGDTLFLAASGKQIEQNAIAWSDSGAGRQDGCPKLNYYARNGIAVPFLPKDGSLTSWPSGAWAVDSHTLDFYTAYVYGSGPYAYWIGEVGLAQLDTDTMQTTVLARKLWEGQRGEREQVIGAMPVEVADDGLLRLIVETKAPGAPESAAVRNVLARVPPAKMADAAAYEYRDGARWLPTLAEAKPLWTSKESTDPVQQLASFENGASIAWNKSLNKYVALVNTSFASVGARTADRLEGPWSDGQPWLDCLSFAQPRVPACYSPQQHAELTGDDGASIVATVSSIEPYETNVFELRPGTAMREWRGPREAVAYAASSPGKGWSDQGIAFYASAAAIDGFAPVYRWRHGDEAGYAAASPGDGFERGDIAFYAAPGAAVSGSTVTYRPVFSWRKGASQLLSPKTTGLEQYGFTRGEAAFYAP
jgi:hypothetical protein